jgi:hypothetical protein
METKLRNNKMGYNNMLVVNSVGRSGGLVLFWKNATQLEILNYSRRHIHAIIKPSNMAPWWFTGFYGHPEAHKRSGAWNLLKHLKMSVTGPWICAGDFNEILVSTEKYGGRRRPRYLMENFKNALEYCELSEIHSRGPKYTWNNGKEGEEFMKERLDRAVANPAWHNLFPKVVSATELAIFSDHLPIIIWPNGCNNGRRRGSGFRFEAGWATNSDCRAIIKKIWKAKSVEQGTWKAVKKKLNDSKTGLVQWKRVNGRNVG